MANAWHQGYYQNKEINEFVENYARKILVQEHGLLYHELITKNISLDSLTIKQAYQKHSIQFKMDLFSFENFIIEKIEVENLVFIKYLFIQQHHYDVQTFGLSGER